MKNSLSRNNDDTTKSSISTTLWFQSKINADRVFEFLNERRVLFISHIHYGGGVKSVGVGGGGGD